MSSPHPASDPYASERPRESPFYPRQKVLNVREAWSAWNGYRFAEYYYDPQYEYFCIRNSCGVYDICPMQKYEISGADAEAMLDRMVTRDVTRIAVGRVAYCVWCTDAGRLIDDGTIFRLSNDRYMLTCGAPMSAWLRKSAFGFSDVAVRDVTDELAALSFQGPCTFSVLRRMGFESLGDMKPFDFRHVPFQGAELLVSRTGFTGDLGYELWIEPGRALALWDALFAAGEDFGIQPYGEEATNMARLEAGFIMPAMEFNEALSTVNLRHDQSPFELGLGWLVDFDKPNFSGRAALLREKAEGAPYTLTRLEIEGNKPADEAHIYRNRACTREVGYVTSAMWSPVAKTNIALAMIETRYAQGPLWAEIYYGKELRSCSRVVRCEVRKSPFWAPARARATPPPDY